MSNLSIIEIDSVIPRLWEVDATSNKNNLDELEIRHLCYRVRKIFLSQPMLLQLQVPLKVIGDIHGQFQDLQRWLKTGGPPPWSSYLFLGDYVDRA